MTLVAAALVPESVLLLPGAAGRADPLAAVRAAAEAEVRHLLEARPARVVVVLGGAARTVHVAAAHDGAPYGVAVTLGALGLPDGVLGPQAVTSRDGVNGEGPDDGPDDAAVLHEPGAVVALMLLRGSGHEGTVEVRVLETAEDAEALGETVEAAAEDVALLLVGSLSARRGPDAPLAEDPRAAEVDERALRALTRLAPEDLRWLRHAEGTVRELSVSALVPWAALVGAMGSGARLRSTGEPLLSAPLGADLVVTGWERDGDLR